MMIVLILLFDIKRDWLGKRNERIIINKIVYTYKKKHIDRIIQK